jgi:hypothetical protein
VSITNHSTTSASGVTLTFAPSAGVLLNSGSTLTLLGACDLAVSVCKLGSLTGGQTATVTMTGTLAGSGGGLVTFAVTHGEADPEAGNDSTSL